MNNKKGFTLIELVAVIAILGVLLLIAIPSVTALQIRIEKRQIEDDIRIFKQQAKNLIRTDVGKDVGVNSTISIKLNEIDQSQLNGKYNSGEIEASGCGYHERPLNSGNEIVTCTTYILKKLDNGKWEVDETTSNPSDPPYNFTKRNSGG